jgi:hypothetical protein
LVGMLLDDGACDDPLLAEGLAHEAGRMLLWAPPQHYPNWYLAWTYGLQRGRARREQVRSRR